jgi:hypothetical protein
MVNDPRDTPDVSGDEIDNVTDDDDADGDGDDEEINGDEPTIE